MSNFFGNDAINQFLHPANHDVQLVELPAVLNRLEKDVRIFGVLMSKNPLGTNKWYPAFHMLEWAKASGLLEGKDTLVEATSSRMGEALLRLAPYFGIKEVRAVMPRDVALLRLDSLRVAGADLVLCKSKSLEYARKLGNKPGAINLNQYAADANPEGFFKYFGPTVFKACPKITLFCAPCGTMGTILGTTRYLRTHYPKLASLGVRVKSGGAVPGGRTEERLQEVAHYVNHRKEVSEFVDIDTVLAYRTSLRLCNLGLDAGPSSGLALAGLLYFLEICVQSNTLDAFRDNVSGLVHAVCVFPDGSSGYSEKYSTHLDSADF